MLNAVQADLSGGQQLPLPVPVPGPCPLPLLYQERVQSGHKEWCREPTLGSEVGSLGAEPDSHRGHGRSVVDRGQGETTAAPSDIKQSECSTDSGNIQRHCCLSAESVGFGSLGIQFQSLRTPRLDNRSNSQEEAATEENMLGDQPSDPLAVTCSIAPPNCPVGEQPCGLQRVLSTHQAEMKQMLAGTLGGLCRRLEAMERRMGQLYEQSVSHGSGLALLTVRLEELSRGLPAGCGATSQLSPGATPSAHVSKEAGEWGVEKKMLVAELLPNTLHPCGNPVAVETGTSEGSILECPWQTTVPPLSSLCSVPGVDAGPVLPGNYSPVSDSEDMDVVPDPPGRLVNPRLRVMGQRESRGGQEGRTLASHPCTHVEQSNPRDQPLCFTTELQVPSDSAVPHRRSQCSAPCTSGARMHRSGACLDLVSDLSKSLENASEDLPGPRFLKGFPERTHQGASLLPVAVEMAQPDQCTSPAKQDSSQKPRSFPSPAAPHSEELKKCTAGCGPVPVNCREPEIKTAPHNGNSALAATPTPGLSHEEFQELRPAEGRLQSCSSEDPHLCGIGAQATESGRDRYEAATEKRGALPIGLERKADRDPSVGCLGLTRKAERARCPSSYTQLKSQASELALVPYRKCISSQLVSVCTESETVLPLGSSVAAQGQASGIFLRLASLSNGSSKPLLLDLVPHPYEGLLLLQRLSETASRLAARYRPAGPRTLLSECRSKRCRPGSFSYSMSSELIRHRGQEHALPRMPQLKGGGRAHSTAFPELEAGTARIWKPLLALGSPPLPLPPLELGPLVPNGTSDSRRPLEIKAPLPLSLSQLFRAAEVVTALPPVPLLGQGGFSRAGLHTALALCSPAYSRLWIRHRRQLPLLLPDPSALHCVLHQILLSRDMLQTLAPLRDHTAPPGLDNDHCYAQRSSQGATPDQTSSETSPNRVLGSIPSVLYPLLVSKAKLTPEPGPPAVVLDLPCHHIPSPKSICLDCGPGESAPSLAVAGANVRYPGLHGRGTSREGGLFEKGVGVQPGQRSKRVSQIRIRKTVPKPDNNLTPMGLPKPKRLKKKEFSLEEIYTNKNYRSPTPNRSLETIFEEPKEKNGALVCIGQQKRKRVLDFPDFTLPRKRRGRASLGGPSRAKGTRGRGRRGQLDEADLDVMLIERLSELEDYFTRQGLDD